MRILSPNRWCLCFLIVFCLLFSVPLWAGEEGVVQSKKLIITGSIVNTRTGPGITFEKVDQVKAGDILSVTGERDGWYQVQLPDLGQAWLAGWLAREVSADYKLIVTGDVVNLRTEPGITHPLVTQVFKNQKYPIIAQKGDWYKIQAGQLQGWIAGWLVKPEPTPISLEPQLGVITGSVVNIRQRPSLDSQIIGKALRGQHKVITGLQEDWYQLELPGENHGWLASWLTEPFRDSTPSRGTKKENSSLALKGRLIVLDPGHSSVKAGYWLDPGAIGPLTQMFEKDVNMSITAKLKRMLENEGARVLLTHTGDTYLSLAERAYLANNNKADVFISIHSNSSANRQLSGHSTYFYAPWGDAALSSQRQSRLKLASLVQKELVSNGGREDLGVREANFAVLRETRVPSILVETAFISHSEEERLLGQHPYREILATAIFKGIKTYFQ